MSYPEDATAERDEQQYAGFLSDYGIPHVCLTCGDRQTVDPHSADYRKFEVLCACGKHCLPEEEITPELAGILLCKRAGASTPAWLRNWIDHCAPGSPAAADSSGSVS